MRPSFYPRLVNGPFDDPGLFISFAFQNRALLFDLGDINSLSPKDILKISHVFVSHTHMDHFMGFDRLLRLLLGREKVLYIYGPEGFLKNIQGKLAGYSWNLVDNYNTRFALYAFEIRNNYILGRQYHCKNRFEPENELIIPLFNKVLIKEPSLSISMEILDHGIPSLGFSFKERFHVNIKKDAVLEMGLSIGPWLNDFKQALYKEQSPEYMIEIPASNISFYKRLFNLKELAEKIALITPGIKITYISDAAFSDSNMEKIIKLAKDSDYLFIEAAFLDEHKDIAENKCHLTAEQAGIIAGKAMVKQINIFHFSPRYHGMEELLHKEASEAYYKTLLS